MVKKLPDVLIRFEPVTDEGVASLAGSGRYDRKSSGIYIVKVYDESGALLTVPGATRSDLKVRCNKTDLETPENKIREEFTKYTQAASQNRLISQSWTGAAPQAPAAPEQDEAPQAPADSQGGTTDGVPMRELPFRFATSCCAPGGAQCSAHLGNEGAVAPPRQSHRSHRDIQPPDRMNLGPETLGFDG
mmetsp:Transcript_62398/g.141087  ORF Transcript_62398/g.141087 Transcript_62398/m.141087 type:complete len:189 (+) Transcript_62398:1455-2021(+)